jgi:hypothetical protein
MHILKADGTIEEFNDNSLEGMQKAVGGYIEIVTTHDDKVMVIDEEGKFKDKPRNDKATSMVSLWPGDYIVGDVIIAEQGEIE